MNVPLFTPDGGIAIQPCTIMDQSTVHSAVHSGVHSIPQSRFYTLPYLSVANSMQQSLQVILLCKKAFSRLIRLPRRLLSLLVMATRSVLLAVPKASGSASCSVQDNYKTSSSYINKSGRRSITDTKLIASNTLDFAQ